MGDLHRLHRVVHDSPWNDPSSYTPDPHSHRTCGFHSAAERAGEKSSAIIDLRVRQLELGNPATGNLDIFFIANGLGRGPKGSPQLWRDR